jgi:arsenite oxidase small subunit
MGAVSEQPPVRGDTAPLSPRRPGAGRWRSEFPYRWDADEIVGRRDLLRLTVFTSGALFAGTAVLALLGRLRDVKRGGLQQIARAGDVAPGSALYFRYPGSDDQAMLLHLPNGQFVAYSQKCTHLSCAVYYEKESNQLACPCHQGYFAVADGAPVQGPPQRALPRVRLENKGGQLIATGMEGEA